MSVTCYWSNWIDGDVPCGPTNTSTPVVPCCQPGSTCYGDGLCYYQGSLVGGSGWYTAACTDASEQNLNCNNRCSNPGHRDVIYNATTSLWACCGSDDKGQLDCANATDETFGAPSPQQLDAYFVAGKGPINSSESTSTSSTIPSSSTLSFSSSQYRPTGSPTPATSPSQTSASTTSSSNKHDHGLSTGAKAGIGVGVALAALLVLSVVVTYSITVRRRRRKANIAATDETDKEENVSRLATGMSQPGLEVRNQVDPIGQSNVQQKAELHGQHVSELDAGSLRELDGTERTSSSR